MSSQSSAVALRSPVANISAAEGYMGDLVAWRFARGGDHAFKAPRDKVQAVFDEAGYGQSLKDNSIQTSAEALAEATRQAIVGRGFIAQEFARKGDDTPYAIGVYYRDGAGEKGDDMICCARVRIVNEVAEALPPEGGTPGFADQAKATKCMVIAIEIAKQANLRMTHTLSTELSAAIVDAGRRCFWASFRKAGGVYWVHAGYAPKIRTLLDGLERLGGFWATLQPLYGDSEGRTLKNVGAAATDAVQAEIDELVAELKKAQNDGMKEKALESRRVRCQELVIRADLYRAVLETSHASIVQRIHAIHRDFGQLLDLSANDGAFDTSGI